LGTGHKAWDKYQETVQQVTVLFWDTVRNSGDSVSMTEISSVLLPFILALQLLELGWIIKLHGCVREIEGRRKERNGFKYSGAI